MVKVENIFFRDVLLGAMPVLLHPSPSHEAKVITGLYVLFCILLPSKPLRLSLPLLGTAGYKVASHAGLYPAVQGVIQFFPFVAASLLWATCRAAVSRSKNRPFRFLQAAALALGSACAGIIFFAVLSRTAQSAASLFSLSPHGTFSRLRMGTVAGFALTFFLLLWYLGHFINGTWKSRIIPYTNRYLGCWRELSKLAGKWKC